MPFQVSRLKRSQTGHFFADTLAPTLSKPVCLASPQGYAMRSIMIARFPDVTKTILQPQLVAGIHIESETNLGHGTCFPHVDDFFRLYTTIFPWRDHTKDVFFGITRYTGYSTFEYWMTFAVTDEHSRIPDCMSSFELTGGAYAASTVPGVGQTVLSWQTRESQWLIDDKFRLDASRTPFERYDERYFQIRLFELYIPILDS